MIAFSTHPAVRRNGRPGSSGTPPDSFATIELGHERVGDLFEPVVDATVEAIYNSLFRATTQQGAFARVEALPIEEVRKILAKYGVIGRQ